MVTACQWPFHSIMLDNIHHDVQKTLHHMLYRLHLPSQTKQFRRLSFLLSYGGFLTFPSRFEVAVHQLSFVLDWPSVVRITTRHCHNFTRACSVSTGCGRVALYVYAVHCSAQKRDIYYTAPVSIGKRDEANQIGRIPLKSGYLDSLQYTFGYLVSTSKK